MKLFGTPGSPFVRKVRIVLAEKDIAYDYIVARASTPDSPVPPYNPLAKIPTLVRDDGITEATVNINHEYREPADRQRSRAWFEKQQHKIDRGLAVMEKDMGAGDWCCDGRYTLADIAAGYALGYLDHALPDYEWRSKHPALARLAARLAERASFSTTAHAKAV